MKDVALLCGRPDVGPESGPLVGGSNKAALAVSALCTAAISRSENCSNFVHGGTWHTSDDSHWNGAGKAQPDGG